MLTRAQGIGSLRFVECMFLRETDAKVDGDCCKDKAFEILHEVVKRAET